VVDKVVESREIKMSFWRNGEGNALRFVKKDEKRQKRGAGQRLKARKETRRK
jgi:hypothetical protein